MQRRRHEIHKNAETRSSTSETNHTATRLSVVPNAPAGELCDDQPALILPGAYRLRFHHWQTAILWGRSHKVALHFTVCDFGLHNGTKLTRYYNVATVVGKPGRNGRYKVKWTQDLVRDYCNLLPPPSRPDRLDLRRLEPLLIVARVETVTTTSKQKPLAPALWYSVVRDLLGVEAGNSRA